MPALAQASSASPPGAPETPTAPTSEPLEFDDDASADDHGAGQMTDAGLHHAWLADGVELGRIGAERGRGPGLARGRRRRVGTGEAVAQHHLRHTETVDDRDRNLISALSAVRERGTGEIERELRAQ